MVCILLLSELPHIKEKLNFFQVRELIGISSKASGNYVHLTPAREFSPAKSPKMHFMFKKI